MIQGSRLASKGFGELPGIAQRFNLSRLRRISSVVSLERSGDDRPCRGPIPEPL